MREGNTSIIIAIFLEVVLPKKSCQRLRNFFETFKNFSVSLKITPTESSCYPLGAQDRGSGTLMMLWETFFSLKKGTSRQNAKTWLFTIPAPYSSPDIFEPQNPCGSWATLCPAAGYAQISEVGPGENEKREKKKRKKPKNGKRWFSPAHPFPSASS